MSKSTSESTSFLTAFCFFAFGLWFSFQRYIFLLAPQDIFSGTLLSSTVVLISIGVPDVVAKILSPFIVRRISFLVSLTLFVISVSLGFVLVVVLDDAHLRISGIVISGLSNGFGSITISRMVAYYGDIEKNAACFQLGCNCSSMVASLFYTGLTTWLCVAPRTTIAAVIPMSWLLLVIYAIIDKEPLKKKEQEKNLKDHVSYAPLSTTNEEAPNSITYKIFRKIDFFYKVVPYLSYFGLSFYLVNLSMNSIVTTLIFPSAPFLPRDHYQYYRLLSDLGIFLGGTEILIVSRLSPDLQSFFKVRRIWVLVLLNAGHLLFFLHASWYHFVSNIAVILVLCLIQGFISGSAAVHSLASSANSFTSTSDQATALGLVELGGSLGRLTSGLMGLFVEGYLRDHCTNRLLLGEKYCLTRYLLTSAWKDNRLDCNL